MSKNKRDSSILAVAEEMEMRPPHILEQTRRKKGKSAAEKQRVAIMLSKARRRGARIAGK